jgi:hypothetical protein
MKRNRVHRQPVVHAVGPVQADRQRRGGRHDHDRRASPEDGLGRADPPATRISVIPEVPNVPQVREVAKVPKVPGLPGTRGSRGNRGRRRR